MCIRDRGAGARRRRRRALLGEDENPKNRGRGSPRRRRRGRSAERETRARRSERGAENGRARPAERWRRCPEVGADGAPSASVGDPTGFFLRSRSPRSRTRAGELERRARAGGCDAEVGGSARCDGFAPFLLRWCARRATQRGRADVVAASFVAMLRREARVIISYGPHRFRLRPQTTGKRDFSNSSAARGHPDRAGARHSDRRALSFALATVSTSAGGAGGRADGRDELERPPRPRAQGEAGVARRAPDDRAGHRGRPQRGGPRHLSLIHI